MDKFLLLIILAIVVVAVVVPAVKDLGQVFAEVARANAVSDMADAYKTQSLVEAWLAEHAEDDELEESNDGEAA